MYIQRYDKKLKYQTLMTQSQHVLCGYLQIFADVIKFCYIERQKFDKNIVSVSILINNLSDIKK